MKKRATKGGEIGRSVVPSGSINAKNSPVRRRGIFVKGVRRNRQGWKQWRKKKTSQLEIAVALRTLSWGSQQKQRHFGLERVRDERSSSDACYRNENRWRRGWQTSTMVPTKRELWGLENGCVDKWAQKFGQSKPAHRIPRIPRSSFCLFLRQPATPLSTRMAIGRVVQTIVGT